MTSDHDAHHPRTYRAYRVGPTERVSSVAIILDASNDEEALAEAHRIVDRVGLEVWDRARRILVIPPTGKPAAPAGMVRPPAGDAAT